MRRWGQPLPPVLEDIAASDHYVRSVSRTTRRMHRGLSKLRQDTERQKARLKKTLWLISSICSIRRRKRPRAALPPTRVQFLLRDMRRPGDRARTYASH